MRRLVLVVCAVLTAVSVFADGPRVARRKPLAANVGVVSVGLDTYWKQCPGLLEDMMKKEDVFVKKIEAHQVKVSRFGMSDNPQKAHGLIAAMKAADLDLLFVDMVTYATSSTSARSSGTGRWRVRRTTSRSASATMPRNSSSSAVRSASRPSS